MHGGLPGNARSRAFLSLRPNRWRSSLSKDFLLLKQPARRVLLPHQAKNRLGNSRYVTSSEKIKGAAGGCALVILVVISGSRDLRRPAHGFRLFRPVPGDAGLLRRRPAADRLWEDDLRALVRQRGQFHGLRLRG